MISINNVSKWYGTFQVLTDNTTQVNKGEVVVVCGSGYRSSIATSLLRRSGRERVTDMIGGMGAWHASRLATGAPA